MRPQASSPTAGAAAGPVRFPIADLHRDGRFQIRHAINRAVVDRYANALRAGITFPPVRLAMVAGVPVLVDGWHRVAAHQAIGASHVEAVITEASEREARWLAAEANLAHGLPLKAREVRDAFRAFIKARRHRTPPRAGQGPGRLSYRDIAKALGGLVTHQTVSNWMHKDFPDTAREYGGEAGTPADAPGPEDPEEGFARAAREAIAQALSAARGVRDPGRRGELVEAAEAALRELRDTRATITPFELFGLFGAVLDHCHCGAEVGLNVHGAIGGSGASRAKPWPGGFRGAAPLHCVPWRRRRPRENYTVRTVDEPSGRYRCTTWTQPPPRRTPAPASSMPSSASCSPAASPA
jgi:hypothetical protein